MPRPRARGGHADRGAACASPRAGRAAAGSASLRSFGPPFGRPAHPSRSGKVVSGRASASGSGSSTRKSMKATSARCACGTSSTSIALTFTRIAPRMSGTEIVPMDLPTRISTISVRVSACELPGTSTVRAPCTVWRLMCEPTPSSEKPRGSRVSPTFCVPPPAIRALTRMSVSLLARGCFQRLSSHAAQPCGHLSVSTVEKPVSKGAAIPATFPGSSRRDRGYQSWTSLFRACLPARTALASGLRRRSAETTASGAREKARIHGWVGTRSVRLGRSGSFAG